MNRFLTIRTASDEIAAQLHPNDAGQRQKTADNYYSSLSDALRAFELAGHDPENYTLITRRDLAGAIALGGALISEAALNRWLVGRDLGIEIHNAGQLPDGQDGDSLLLAEKDRLRAKSGTVQGGVYVALAKKYGISEDNAKYRCRKAKALRDGPPRPRDTPVRQQPKSELVPRATGWAPFGESHDPTD